MIDYTVDALVRRATAWSCGETAAWRGKATGKVVSDAEGDSGASATARQSSSTNTSTPLRCSAAAV